MVNSNSEKQHISNTQNPVILSFCIPTYNRAEFVYECVTNILKYPGSDIEVVVSDNASPDNTQDLLSTIKDSRFRYSRNEMNLGYEGNFPKALSLANGQFCTLVSDEDEILVENIPWFCEFLRKNENIGMLLTSVAKKGGELYYYKFNDTVYPAGIKTLKRFRFSLLYMTGPIFNKEKLNITYTDRFLPQTLYYCHNFYNYVNIGTEKELFLADARRGVVDFGANIKDGKFHFEIDSRVNHMFSAMINFYKSLSLSSFNFNIMCSYALYDIINAVKETYNKGIVNDYFLNGDYDIKDYNYFKIKRRLFGKLDEVTNWASIQRFFNLSAIHLFYWPIAFKENSKIFLSNILSTRTRKFIKKLLRM